MAEVYIVKNLMLNRELSDSVRPHISFNAAFTPTEADVVPALPSRAEDVELSKHVGNLLHDSNVNMGKVIFNAKLSSKEIISPKTLLNKTMDDFKITVGGGFSWMLRELFGEIQNTTDMYFKIRLKNVITGTENCVSGSYISVYKFVHYSRIGAYWEEEYEGFQEWSTKFVMNAPTWKNFFGKTLPIRKDSFPSVDIILCCKPLVSLLPKKLIISPYGDGFVLTLSLKKEVDQRREELKNTHNLASVTLVSNTGKAFTVVEKYLDEASSVLATMVNNPNFKEGQTKKVVFPELDDAVVEALVNWISFFDLSIPIKILRVAVRMLELCEQYQMEMLKTYLISILDQRENQDVCVSAALRLFAFARHFPEFQRFSHKSLTILYFSKLELRSTPEYMEMFDKDPALARELCTALFERQVY